LARFVGRAEAAGLRGGAVRRAMRGGGSVVYKAWFPLTGEWLDLTEADITIDPATTGFTARLLVPGPVVDGERWATLTGRFAVRDGLLVTAVAGGHA
jgi:enterobactin synthetase component D / holo-[acyl-carrier protein] synthase